MRVCQQHTSTEPLGLWGMFGGRPCACLLNLRALWCAAGFVGSIVLEQLFRECPGVKKVGAYWIKLPESVSQANLSV